MINKHLKKNSFYAGHIPFWLKKVIMLGMWLKFLFFF